MFSHISKTGHEKQILRDEHRIRKQMMTDTTPTHPQSSAQRRKLLPSVICESIFAIFPYLIFESCDKMTSEMLCGGETRSEIKRNFINQCLIEKQTLPKA